MLASHPFSHTAGEETGFRWLLAILGTLPALSYFALLLFASAAFVSTGHWPAASYPDPKTFSAATVPLLWLVLAAAACATPVYFVMAIVQVCHLRSALSRIDVSGMAVYLIGLALWLFGSRNLLVWFLD